MRGQLTSNDDLTQEIVESGVVSFEDLIRCVQRFHYGRNTNRADLSLVWHERKGSCSSKHAFLKMMADLNHIPGVELILCIYRMNPLNTAGIGAVLSNAQLEYIPEAHCFLNINGEDLDVTFPHSSIEKLDKDIVHRQVIQPHDIVENKLNFHKNYIKNWIETEDLQFSFEEIWKVREACIRELECINSK